ncbi:hypothetical protein [Enterovirga sp. CN4-39]|uniref:hypothetical protein n=1 Tax=Enterovirga sp. CN4-39 TaxID=3400910 RepID=UPI003C125531
MAEPVYAYDHETIDRDCDAVARWPASCAEGAEVRRARLHRELDEAMDAGQAPEQWPAGTVPVIQQAHDDRKGLLQSYNEWLFYERRLLCKELFPDEPNAESFVPQNTGASRFHFPDTGSWQDQPQPSARAAVVLAAAGCDWRDQEHRPSRLAGLPSIEQAAGPDPDFDSVDVLWRRWRELGRECDLLPIHPDEDDEGSPLSFIRDRIREIEDAIARQTSSPMAAAACILIEIAGSVMVDTVPSAERRWFALSALNSLRPHLRGAVAETVASILDHPDRVLGESMLFSYKDVVLPADMPLLQAAE